MNFNMVTQFLRIYKVGVVYMIEKVGKGQRQSECTGPNQGCIQVHRQVYGWGEVDAQVYEVDAQVHHTGQKKQNVQVRMCMSKTAQDTKNTHKTQRKLTTIPIPSKQTNGNKKKTQNAAARAKPPQQTKQTKCRTNKQM